MAGCKPQNLVSPSQPAELVPLVAGIVLTQNVANPGTGARTLQWQLRTTNELPCMNYRLLHRLHRTSAGFEVDVLGVQAPEICLTALGPANATLELANLLPGSHRFRLRVGQQAATGMLVITSQNAALRLHGTPGNWFTLENAAVDF